MFHMKQRKKLHKEIYYESYREKKHYVEGG